MQIKKNYFSATRYEKPIPTRTRKLGDDEMGDGMVE